VRPDESVTDWIAVLKAEDDSLAAERLYQRYIHRLKALARAKLGATSRRTCDEEDIAIIALQSVFQGIREDRFHRLNDRDDLWQVLVMLVDRRVTDQIRRASRQKRGPGRELGESALESREQSGSQIGGIGQVIDREPTPAFAAELLEESRRRLAELGDRSLQEIAIQKLKGYTNAEIAQGRGCTERTVERKLKLIRKIWETG
jgi:RNA polymerase sigma factor (sigma-70 family)